MGTKPMGNHFNAQKTRNSYWINLQPTYLPENVRLPAEEGRSRYNDHKGPWEMGESRNGTEVH